MCVLLQCYYNIYSILVTVLMSLQGRKNLKVTEPLLSARLGGLLPIPENIYGREGIVPTIP